MKSLVLSLGLAAVLCLASTAQATSPCCDAAASNRQNAGKQCDALGSAGLAGCAELDDQNCVGGGPVLDAEPGEQSPIAGCLCVGGTCVSDGGGAGAADPEICTRDAVFGCCENGACSDAE